MQSIARLVTSDSLVIGWLLFDGDFQKIICIIQICNKALSWRLCNLQSQEFSICVQCELAFIYKALCRRQCLRKDRQVFVNMQ